MVSAWLHWMIPLTAVGKGYPVKEIQRGKQLDGAKYGRSADPRGPQLGSMPELLAAEILSLRRPFGDLVDDGATRAGRA
jgi:hypothetical protein